MSADPNASEQALSQPALRRVVSRWQIVALAINGVVGSAVYLLPASAADLLGPASIAAVAAAGLAVFLIVLCFAEAASYFDEPGSAYLYARTAFGDAIGFQVGWMSWLARVATVASLAVGFAQALAYLWPPAGEGWGRAAAIIVPQLLLTAINYVGVEHGARMTVFLTLGKLLPLALFLVAGAFAASWPLLVSQQAGSDGGFAAAAMLLLFAYAGFENTAAAAGEFRNPRRDIPFALMMQVALVTVLYVGVQAVALATLPDLGSSKTPLAQAAALFLGPWGGLILTAGAVVSILGTNNNSILAGPRYLYALARDGYGPAALGRVHPRWQTPAIAIVTQTAIALPLALHGSFKELAALSVITRLFTYLGTTAALPVLRRKLPAREGAFRLPGGLTIPIAASLLALAFGSAASRENLQAAAVAIVVGIALYALRRKAL